MSPQPTTPTKPTEATAPANGKTDDEAEAKAKREAAEKERQEAIAKLTELASRDTPAGRQIARAVRLEQEDEGLSTRINKNREYLRLMDDNDELTDDESAWLAVFHPLKVKDERRSKDDVEATRKAKDVARSVKLPEAS